MHCCHDIKEFENDDFTNLVLAKKNDNRWFLEYENFSRKQDVIDGESEKEGEFLYGLGILIRYCPFCGEKLI